MGTGYREIRVWGFNEYPLESIDFDVIEEKLMIAYHYHPEIEILNVVRGGFFINIGSKIYEANDGDVFFVSPNIPHSLRGESLSLNHMQYNAIIISPSLFTFPEGNIFQKNITAPLCQGRLYLPPKICREDICWERIHDSVEKITEFCRDPFDMCGKIQTISLLIDMLSTMYSQKKLSSDTKNISETERIKKILSYIDENYSSVITLASLADICGLSEKYFCSYFKEQTGITPISHINSVRIAAACDKLKKTDESVTSVALDCGFDNIGYFIRMFSRIMGVTPGEWRRRIRRTTSR